MSLINLEECFFPELLASIYKQVKVEGLPLEQINKKYGERLARLCSTKKILYDFQDWICFGGEALLLKCVEKHEQKRTVAIKIASPRFNEPGQREVYQGYSIREFRVENRNTFQDRFWRGLQHQISVEGSANITFGSVPSVYEISRKPLYFVMQYIDGPPYDKWVLSAPREERLRLFEKFLRFIQELHLHYIFHRDLKPNNFMVRGDRPCLIDFTTAKSLDDDANVTVFQLGLGCDAYAAPEVKVDIRQADHRSDIYSCGKILEFTWTQEPPFSEGKALPPPLSQVYLKACQYNKEDRFQYMSEFITAYIRALKHLNLHGTEQNTAQLETLLDTFGRYWLKRIVIPLFSGIQKISKEETL